MHIKQLITIILVAILAACTPKIDNRGYISEVNWKAQVIPGKTTKDEVMSQFGSPSSQSSFGEETWYYITQRKETMGFMETEVAAQDVVRIAFDASGLATAIDIYNEGNSKDFDIAKRTTPTEGHTLGFIEQVLGNIGRFNKPGGGGGSPSPGRRSGGGY